MEYIQELGLVFKEGQILKSEQMNLLARKVNELVGPANQVHEVKAYAEDTRKLVDNVEYLRQDVFDEMNKAGTLDPEKEYRTYED